METVSSSTSEYHNQIREILLAGYTYVSDVSPSDWTEHNIVMPKPFPGKFSYSKTPYAREIIDCLADTHEAHTVALMKGAQIGMSSGVIIPGIGWIIQNNPGNTYLSVGAPELIEKAMAKVDYMIDSAGLRQLIAPQSHRARNNKTGDTNYKKDFPGGYVVVSSANNHKNLRQDDIQFIFLDDLEAIKTSSEQSGDTLSMVETRQASYYGKSKLFLVSTPELKEKSNIEPAYLKGDQRKYMVPCPCCGVFIEIKWAFEREGDKKMVGINWQLDEKNELIEDSVGYVCQECGEFFNDKNKTTLLNEGKWVPTAKPITIGYRSYHISSLYAPIGMFDWKHYVKKYLEACPIGKPRDEQKYKTFINVCLGLTYELETENLSGDKVSRNCRDYDIGTVPEKQSIEDGNGEIVLLTAACDLNGTEHDARLDYSIWAWSESGSRYSITHGSIGTFIPNQTKKQKEESDRLRYTYMHNEPNSVWTEFENVLNTDFEVDTDERRMRIFVAGVDTGYQEEHAFTFIENHKSTAIMYGLKGDKEEKYLPFTNDLRKFKKGQSRANLYMVLGGKIKDELSKALSLKWDSFSGTHQPAGYCNYPQPSRGLYKYNNYFSHYEAERRTIEAKTGAFKWVKKDATAQNHLWDCHVYNVAVKEIFMDAVFKDMKIVNGTWVEFVSILLGTYQAKGK